MNTRKTTPSIRDKKNMPRTYDYIKSIKGNSHNDSIGINNVYNNTENAKKSYFKTRPTRNKSNLLDIEIGSIRSLYFKFINFIVVCFKYFRNFFRKEKYYQVKTFFSLKKDQEVKHEDNIIIEDRDANSHFH